MRRLAGASPDLLVKYKTFTGPSTGGNGVSQSVAHGLGDTPQAVFLFGVGHTAHGESSHVVASFGLSDGTSEFAVCAIDKDNVTTTLTRRRQVEDCYIVTDQDNTVQLQGHVSSFDSTNVNFVWDTNLNNGYQIHMVTFGGGDLVDVGVKTFNASTSGGTQLVNIGFVAEGAIFLSVADGTAPPASNVGMALTVGFQGAAGTAEAVSCTIWSENGVTTSDLAQKYSTSDSIGWIVPKAGSISDAGRGYVSAWKTDGYAEITWSATPEGTYLVGGLFFNGGNYYVDDELVTRTTNGNQSYTGYEVQPVALLLMGFRLRNSETGVRSHYNFGFGACSDAGGIVEGAIGIIGTDGVTTTDTNMESKNDKNFFVKAIPDNDGDLVSMDAAPGFTQTWTTIFDQNQIFFVFGFGDGDANPPAVTSNRRRILGSLIGV